MSRRIKRGLYEVNDSIRAKEWSEAKIIVVSFLAILFPSALLLMLPVFSISGLSFSDALFTATSAISVTGLGVVDTGTHFTVSGKILLMLLMQIGGLGQMTLSALLLYIFGLRLSLRQQALAKEALGQEKKVNVGDLVKSIMFFALIAELVGMIILSYRWIPEFGVEKGLFYAAFHAISAFNNAGFSLFSESLTGYAGDYLVIFTLSCLFIGGGLGFTVITDLVKNSTRGFTHLQLHTKIMIIATPVLLILGTLFFVVLEYNNPQTLAPLSDSDKWLAAFFQSASARTAGFNSVNIADFTQPALFIMIILMLIGAGSTSTGGGLKVSTITVAAAATWTFLRQKQHVVLFKRTVGWPTVTKSLAIIVVSGSVLSIAIFILMLTENADFNLVVFEVISAFATVGLTAGLTADLSEAGKFIMVIVMIIGRIGPLTLAYMLARPENSHVKYPEDSVLTG